MMYIIAGLGNPGSKYAHTRHNVGFDTVEYLADYYGIDIETKKFQALVGQGVIEGNKVLLVKPQTYMNLSGESLREVVNFYKIDPEEELIVIYDDISLNPGQLRLRGKGSAGGHNGIKDILYQLQSDQFPRIKIGVGAPDRDREDLKDFVLDTLDSDAYEGVKRAPEAVITLLCQGVDQAMQQFNGSGPISNN